ncbi:Ig-like domain-containing protein [Leifsonia aquatica]|uniref:Ig-like domain-containing protein n=1 Tax=Leifsonia aquatica TaxID=144185 RepID=UPI00384F2E7C
MSRALRISLISAAVAITAALAVPSAAQAAGGDALTLTSPSPGATIAPGQVFTGTAVPPAAQPGDEIRLHAFSISNPIGHCVPETQVGSSIVGQDGSFAITMEKPIGDGLTIATVCTDTADVSPGVLTVDNPFTVTSPADGNTLSVDDATVSGVGSPGSTVNAVDGDGTPIGSAVVADDGTWTLTFTDVAQGPLDVTFTQGAKTIDADFVIAAEKESSPLVDPAIAGGALALAVAAAGAVFLRRRSLSTSV